MSHVWRESKTQGGELLVLLAIADRADDSGIAWPRIAELSAKSRLSPRQVYRIIKILEDLGELSVLHGGGRHKPNRYQITLTNFQCNNVTVNKTVTPTSQNGDTGDTETVTPMSPHTSVDPSSTSIVGTETGTALTLDQARDRLTAFCRKHFVRIPTPAQWHNCYDSHLEEVMPISLHDLETLDRFYSLPIERLRELKTGVRAQFANVMAYLGDEIQKAYAAFKESNKLVATKKDPRLWREFLRARYSADVRLPENFEQLDVGLRREYRAGIDEFQKTMGAGAR